MTYFGTVENPFSTEYINDEYLYIKKLFGKKVNTHLVEILKYLNSTEEAKWQINEIEEIDSKFDPQLQMRFKNKEKIYQNYKNTIIEEGTIHDQNLSLLFNLKTLFTLDNEVEENQKEVNYQLLTLLADQIISDIEITNEEICLSDKLCEIFSINKSEFASILHNKSGAVISSFVTGKTRENITAEEIGKIKSYYLFLNSKNFKYDTAPAIQFLNQMNGHCVESGTSPIGLCLNVGFPSMTNFPLFAAYECMVSKMKKVKGQKLFEQTPATLFHYGSIFLIAYRYSYLNSFNGVVDVINLKEVREYGDGVFINTNERYFWLQKKGERNPYAISGVMDLRGMNFIHESTKSFAESKELKIANQRDELGIGDPKNESAGKKEDANLPSEVEDYLSEINKLIGISEIKTQINSLINFIKFQSLRSQKDLKRTAITLHCVFTGSPGTGKTTVARLFGGALKQLGMLRKGHLIEVDRSGIVAGYLGQTAIKIDEVINKALDGILFIDEAYSLTSSPDDSYGKEAVDVLLKRMEDNRDRLVVILAGYTSEMGTFIESNPGLKSRFTRILQFDDFSSTELFNIFELLCKENQYVLSDSAASNLKNHFEEIINKKEKNFGNGRYVRNCFEKIVERHSNRVVNLQQPSESDLMTFELEDVKV